MAAKGLFNVQCKLLICDVGRILEPNNSISRPLLCYQQNRGKRIARPSKIAPRPWFVRKKATPHMKYLTEENKELLDNVALHQYKNQPSPLRDEPWPRNEWTPSVRRAGLLGVKIGVQPQWKKDGTRILCQLIQIVDNHVIRYTPPEEYQKSLGYKPMSPTCYGSLVVGAMSTHPWNYSKAYHNLFLEAGVPPKRKLTRFLITPDAAIQPGTPLSVHHFKVGQYVNCSAKTIARGFQGVMKRWGFSGGPASHGSTKFHRRPGSISSGMDRGIVKGKKMPGWMGNDWRTLSNVKIWRINTKYNVLYVSVGIPGPHHGYVRINDSVTHKIKQKYVEAGKQFPMPTYYEDDATEPYPEDIYDEELFPMTENSITFEQTE
ncbi:54S ribosomal protein L3 [Mactra antiquata]